MLTIYAQRVAHSFLKSLYQKYKLKVKEKSKNYQNVAQHAKITSKPKKAYTISKIQRI